MSLASVRSRRSSWFLASAAAGTLLGCSFLYELQTTQCEFHEDCQALGPQFDNTICVNRVCVERDDGAGASGGNGGSSGTSGKGGSSGTSGAAGTSVEAGAGGASGEGTGGSTGGSGGSGKGGASGSAGKGGASASGGSSGSDAGTGGAPECETNGDCIDAHVDQPYICREGSCVLLTNDNCPVLLPSEDNLELLRAPAPLIVGGFANMGNINDPMESQAIINWDLAFSEFNGETLGGFPPNDGSGDKRPVLGLFCKSATDVQENMEHLAGHLRLPAILSTLPADSLLTAHAYTRSSDYLAAGGQSVFFMSTGSADLRLATLVDNGLVWHQLGNPRVLARTTAALLTMIEPIVNERRQAYFEANSSASGVEDPAYVDLRVTLVYSDDVVMTDVANVLTAPSSEDTSTMLFFNGLAAIDQVGDPGDFRQVRIESSRNHSPADVSDGITEIQNHPPHVIVAMGTAETAGNLIPGIENTWGSGVNTQDLPRPFYVLSHFIYNTSELPTTLDTVSSTFDLQTRMLGVNYAAALDPDSQALYNAYLGRLQGSYSGTLALGGTENYYDGAYMLLYALAKASTSRFLPDGEDIRDALDVVISTDTDAISVDIGPSNIYATVNKLSTDLGFNMAMWGTMGPPNFDSVTGTRVSATSAWCIEDAAGTWTYRADGLLFEPETSSFSAPPSVPACMQEYAP